MKIKDNRSKMDKAKKMMKELNNYTIQIGIFADDDSFIQMIAGVHEFGLTIFPKNARYLTVPLAPEFVGKSAGMVPGLFFHTAATGNRFLVRSDGNSGLEFAYMLMDSVNVPERSFIRSTFDEKEKEWSELFSKLVTDEILKGGSLISVFDKIGAKIASDIQDTMRDLKDPPKQRSTKAAAPNKSNPLIQTGRMRQSVTWKVVRK